MATEEAVRDAIRAGQLPRAEELAGELLQDEGTPDAYALYGDVMGRMGKRADAEDWLEIATDQFPQNGYILAVLGEQRIRQARWDEGTDDFVAALGTGDEEAFRHAQEVIRDLIDAHLAGKVRETDAMKFVNRLDYNVPQKTNEMSSFFAGARRALANGTRLEEQVRRPSAPPPKPPPRKEPPRRQKPPSASRRGRAQKPPQKAPAQPPRRETDGDLAPELRVDAGFDEPLLQSARGAGLASVMERETQLNERMQQLVSPIGQPIWPSLREVQLDQIPVLRPELLGFTEAKMEKSALQLTTGSVDTEILLERCLQNLLQAVQWGTARPVMFEAEDITKVEVNAWDGMLDRLTGIPKIYRHERPEIDQAVLALGRFLGEVITHVFDATWEFTERATDSYVKLQKARLEPFDLAERWVQASDKDDVDLFTLVRQAHQAADERDNRFAVIKVDETRDLEGRALSMKLAELWTYFRAHPNEVPLVEIAEDVRPIELLDNAILFALKNKWAPDQANLGGRMDEVAIAFLRGTGEFLILASRKHFARLLEILYPRLDSENASEIVDFFDRFHRPDLSVIRSKKGRDGDHAPVFTPIRGGGGALTVAGRQDGRLLQWRIVNEPDSPQPWRIELSTD